MPEPLTVAQILVGGARLLEGGGGVYPGGERSNVLEAERRGEPSREQLIAGLGLPARTPRAIPSAAPPPAIVPPAPTIGPGGVPPLIPVPPTAIPPYLPVGIVGSIPNVPGYPPPLPPSPGAPPIIQPGQGVPTREGLLRRQGMAEARRMAEREAAASRRAATIERQLWRRAALGRLGAIGVRIGGAIAGVLYPSRVAEGVPTPAQVAEMEKEAARVRGEQLKPVIVGRERLEAARRALPPGTDPSVLQVVSVGAKMKGLPQTARQPGTRVAPAPTTTRTRLQRSILGRLPWAQILLGALLGPGRTSSISPAVTPTVSSLTRVEPDPLPSDGGAAFVPGIRPGTAQCDCPPKKKRKPSRKCLERAQVVWKSGRYKGKVAGKKCVRFEGKK